MSGRVSVLAEATCLGIGTRVVILRKAGTNKDAGRIGVVAEIDPSDPQFSHGIRFDKRDAGDLSSVLWFARDELVVVAGAA